MYAKSHGCLGQESCENARRCSQEHCKPGPPKRFGVTRNSLSPLGAGRISLRVQNRRSLARTESRRRFMHLAGRRKHLGAKLPNTGATSVRCDSPTMTITRSGQRIDSTTFSRGGTRSFGKTQQNASSKGLFPPQIAVLGPQQGCFGPNHADKRWFFHLQALGFIDSATFSHVTGEPTGKIWWNSAGGSSPKSPTIACCSKAHPRSDSTCTASRRKAHADSCTTSHV